MYVKSLKTVQRCNQNGKKGLHYNPSNQHVAKKFPTWRLRSPKTAQLVAKIDQNTPLEPPTRPSKTLKWSKNDVLSFVFRLVPFLQRFVPRPPKLVNIAAQMASWWPSWCQLGPSWRHLGSNLVPSWPTWARFSTIRAPPKSTKISRDSFWQIFPVKVVLQTSQILQFSMILELLRRISTRMLITSQQYFLLK